MDPLSHFIFTLANQFPQLGTFFVFISYPFSYAVPVGFAAYTFLAHPRGFRMLFYAGVVATLSFVLAYVVKNIVRIPRPQEVYGIIPLVQETGYAFPSAHATVFAAIAGIGFIIHPKLGILCTAAAFLVGISRIGLGVHTSIEVVTGWILGASIAYVGYLVLYKFV